jgi:hypothetical protein
VDGVRPGVPGPLAQLVGFDDLHDLRLPRVLQRIENIDPRRPEPRNDEVTPLHVRVRRVRAQRAAARVPAEVVQLVARVRQVGPADDAAVVAGGGVGVEHRDRVGLSLAAVEGRDVGERLRGASTACRGDG